MLRLGNMVPFLVALIPACATGQVCVRQLSVPDYPPLAWAAQLTGAVNLTVTIGGQGQVVRVEGTGSVPVLIEQAKANVKGWKFCDPKKNQGAQVQLRYIYQLKGTRVYPPPTAKVVVDLGEATVLITLPPPEPQP